MKKLINFTFMVLFSLFSFANCMNKIIIILDGDDMDESDFVLPSPVSIFLKEIANLPEVLKQRAKEHFLQKDSLDKRNGLTIEQAFDLAKYYQNLYKEHIKEQNKVEKKEDSKLDSSKVDQTG